MPPRRVHDTLAAFGRLHSLRDLPGPVNLYPQSTSSQLQLIGNKILAPKDNRWRGAPARGVRDQRIHHLGASWAMAPGVTKVGYEHEPV